MHSWTLQKLSHFGPPWIKIPHAPITPSCRHRRVCFDEYIMLRFQDSPLNKENIFRCTKESSNYLGPLKAILAYSRSQSAMPSDISSEGIKSWLAPNELSTQKKRNNHVGSRFLKSGRSTNSGKSRFWPIIFRQKPILTVDFPEFLLFLTFRTWEVRSLGSSALSALE